MRIPIIVLSIGLAAVTAISVVIRESFLVGAASLIGLVAIGGAGVHSVRRNGGVQKKQLSAILVGMLILAGLGLTNAPLRATFSIFEPGFDSMGRQLVGGAPPDFPTWIGPFRVVDGGVREGSGAPYLMTSGHPFEINGFVRDPKGKYFNLWSITPLGGSWAYIEED